MPSVRGRIWSTDGTNFSLTFDIDDLPIYGSGRFINSLLPPFVIQKASMAYTNLDDLTAIRDVAGVLGKASLNLATLKGEATIEGNLSEPLPSEIPFTGRSLGRSGSKRIDLRPEERLEILPVSYSPSIDNPCRSVNLVAVR